MVRTRIAPSPTGHDIHIGNLYTALINWTYARKHNGQFIIRVEDTDRERLVEGAEARILSTFKAFGLDYDEGPDLGGLYAPYRQSDRLKIYHKHAKELVEKGHAYYCFCKKERLDEIRKKQISEKKIPRYDRYCLNNIKIPQELIDKGEKYVIRLKVPENRTIIFNDVIRGEIKFESNNIDDQILIKSDGYPTYHMAVVIDDYLMSITHVIRAEEWIPSTPKHILLYEAFGWPFPIYAHLPILRNPDKSKLSKRKNPVFASWYLEQGFLPKAMLNFLALMGWSHPEQKEIFDLNEFKEKFELEDMQPVGPAFDIVKLEWMNGEYIRRTPNDELRTLIYEFYLKEYPEDLITKTVPLIKERIKKLSDYLPLCEFFFKEPEVDLSGVGTGRDLSLPQKIHDELEKIEDWKADVIGEKMQELAKRENVKAGDFFMTLRVAITGKKISPPLNESMEILGKEKCLERLSKI
ncbi:MAG: glutamate--tRNA ligase [Candidatus Roizmanbacteria bacterium]|nr:MAG: glutamate--tRNA ligase [Candidatus Roizmanbacteria bacterium]